MPVGGAGNVDKHDFAQPYFGNRIDLLGDKIGHSMAMFLTFKASLETALLEISRRRWETSAPWFGQS